MNPESQAAACTTGGGAVRISVGLVVLAVGFVTTTLAGRLGLDALRPVIPLALVAGIVILGTGFHRVLWAPPRDAAPVPAALRPVISGLVAIACSAVLSFVIGRVGGFVRSRGESSAQHRGGMSR